MVMRILLSTIATKVLQQRRDVGLKSKYNEDKGIYTTLDGKLLRGGRRGRGILAELTRFLSKS